MFIFERISKMSNNKKLWISHSKKELANKCMKQFFYKYIEKVELEDEVVDTSASDFGSCIHEIAENYTGGGKEELLALYHKLVPSKYVIADHYKKKIGTALKNVHTYYVNFLKKQKGYEHELDLTVDFNDDIVLTGKIDIKIDKDDGKVRVVDYKTKKSMTFYDPTDQLAMYMLMLNLKYGIPLEDIDCEIVYLSLDPEDKKGNQILNEGYENIAKVYNVSVEDVEILKREIMVLLKRINKNKKTGEWLPQPSWFNCTYCPYKKICEDRDESVSLD
jgi:RecB family exonuclease